MRQMQQTYLGVDLGGTKILTAVVDHDGRIIARRRLATPPGGPEPVVGAIVESAQAVCAAAGLSPPQTAGLGVGAPGPMDPATGVVFEPPNLPGWRDVPLAEVLERRLGVRVHVENDANAGALAERWAGAGQGVDDLIYMTVSTGIGGGLILGGRLHRGVSGTAGEIGHMVIEADGPPCNCGRLGCLEAIASGPSIARGARLAIQAGRVTILSHMPVDEVTAKAVARAALDGDILARELYARAAAALGRGIANVVNLLNPALVILGGGVMRAGDLILGPVRRIVREEAFDRPAAAVRIVPAALGDDAGVVGAAAVVRERATARNPFSA